MMRIGWTIWIITYSGKRYLKSEEGSLVVHPGELLGMTFLCLEKRDVLPP